MHLPHYLGLLVRAEEATAAAFREVIEAHGDEPDVAFEGNLFAVWSDRHAEALRPFLDHYGEEAPPEPENLHHDLFQGPRSGGLGLMRDLHDLYLMVTECDLSWIVVGQAAQGLADMELLDVVQRGDEQTNTVLSWLRTRMKHAAPQALVVAS